MWNEELIQLGLGSEVSRMLCYDGRRPQLNDLHAHQDGQEINFPHGEFTQKSNPEPVSEENKRSFNGFLRLRKLGDGKLDVVNLV